MLNKPIGNLSYQGGVSEMFASYEEDFHHSESEIRKLLAKAGQRSGAPAATGSQDVLAIDERIQAIFNVEQKMQVAEQQIAQMEQEVKTLPPAAPTTGVVQQRVRQYRSLLVGFRREYSEVRANVDRDALLAERRGGRDAELVKNSRFRETGNRIAAGTGQLKDAHRMAVDTEATGTQIMSDLRQQREVIQQSRQHIDNIDRNLTNSRRVLLQMSRRVLTNKIILMSTALVLSLTLLLLLFIKLKGK
ncbi:unnamed protein product [Amoebophrya sp. A120]|nr:unnamed protein product [Amoebophrya sp. A120]|eukprot:GSA120T00005080001.1